MRNSGPVRSGSLNFGRTGIRSSPPAESSWTATGVLRTTQQLQHMCYHPLRFSLSSHIAATHIRSPGGKAPTSRYITSLTSLTICNHGPLVCRVFSLYSLDPVHFLSFSRSFGHVSRARGSKLKGRDVGDGDVLYCTTFRPSVTAHESRINQCGTVAWRL